MNADAAEILVPGPWEHRFVAANGGRFHVVEAGEGPLVLLLHGFPQFWWCWRHQLAALAGHGYRVAAMDLRGYGASDKPPRGYDTPTLCADVAGVVRSLGATRAVVAGHDWGGWIAWSMPALQPRVTRAVAAVSMGHPLAVLEGAGRGRQRAALRRLLALQLPVLPERSLAGTGVPRLLRDWAPDHPWSEDELERYRRAAQLPFVAHTAAEYFRWAFRSRGRRDGRRFAAAVRAPVTVPVLQLHGGRDPWVLPETAAASARWVDAPLDYRLLPGAGHLLPEEAPDEVARTLADWLDDLPPDPRA